MIEHEGGQDRRLEKEREHANELFGWLQASEVVTPAEINSEATVRLAGVDHHVALPLLREYINDFEGTAQLGMWLFTAGFERAVLEALVLDARERTEACAAVEKFVRELRTVEEADGRTDVETEVIAAIGLPVAPESLSVEGLAEVLAQQETASKLSPARVPSPRHVPTRAPLRTMSAAAHAQSRPVGERELFLLQDEDKDEKWQERALCAQTDPEAFFPEKGGSTREAKRVCQNCDVREDCLQEALDNDERFGIWGGLSERERRKLKKRKPVTASAKEAIEAEPVLSRQERVYLLVDTLNVNDNDHSATIDDFVDDEELYGRFVSTALEYYQRSGGPVSDRAITRLRDYFTSEQAPDKWTKRVLGKFESSFEPKAADDVDPLAECLKRLDERIEWSGASAELTALVPGVAV